MKCPKCKKPSELQTKRTLANGRSVARERHCPKCRGQFWTTELFDMDVQEQTLKHKKDVEELVHKYTESNSQLSVIRGHIKSLIQFAVPGIK